MPRANQVQTNFVSGEVSPLIAGRVDTKVYANGLRTCQNFIVKPQGALSNRGGTKYTDWATRSSTTGKLIPFRFSDTDNFQIELGDYYARILRNGYPVLNSTSMYSAISAVATSGGAVRVTFTNENRVAVAVSDNGSGLIRLTSTLPHNLVSGDRVYYVPDFTTYIVTFISSTVVDLVASTYGAHAPTYMMTSNLVSGSSSAGGLIKITTYVPHGLDTGDKIYMEHTGPANGVDFSATPAVFDWVITVVDDTSFTLNASVYTAGSDTADDKYVVWLRNGQRITIDGTGGSQNLDGDWRVIQSTARDFVVLANSTFVGATAGSYLMYFSHIKLNTPWADTELDEVTFCQSADVLYLMHPDHSTRKLVRFNNDNWTLQEIDFKDGPYLPLQDNAPAVDATTPENGTFYPDVYLEVSSYAHTATVKAAVAFDNGDDNKYFEYRDGDQWRLAKIGTVAGGETSVSCTILDNVLLHLDETTKFKNTTNARVIGNIMGRVTYDAGSPNASPSVPGAGTQQRMDPNNYAIGDTTGAAGKITSNYSNTFGVADVGKYIRYFDSSAIRKPLWALITFITSGSIANHAGAVSMCTNNATGNFVITAHSRTGTVKSYRAGATFAIFASTDVGRHIRLAWGGRWTWGIITGYTSTSQVAVTFYEDIPRDPHNANNLAGALNGAETSTSTTGRTYNWRLGAWSTTTGFPSTAAFHEQRLVFARTDTQPSTFWGSITGDFENMRPTELDSTVLDDNAISYTLASGLVNAIKWLESGINLVIGTNGGEWLARSSSATQQPITPTNISVTQQGRNGSSRIAAPMRIGSSIVFVDRSERKVMEVAYLFSEDRLADKNLTVVSEHILRDAGTVVQTAFQHNHNPIGWFCMSDGTLVALTYNQEQEIIAWHKHSISGTGAEVESIAVTPSEDATSDVLYMLVKRTINGATKRTIEFLTPDFYPTGSSRLGMTFLDDCAVITGWTSLTVNGLYHLEAESVYAVVDGTVRGPFIVSAGAITITGTAPVSEIVIGKAYTATAKSLPIEGGSEFGSSMGMKKRLCEIKIRVWKTFNMNFGWQASLVALDATGNTAVRSETALPYFTGTMPGVPNMPYDEESPWTITQDKPYPLNILAVVGVMQTNQ